MKVWFATLLSIGLLFIAGPGYSQSPSPTPKRLTVIGNDPQLLELYLNINQKCRDRLSGEFWTLTHAYESKKEVDEVLEYFTYFFTTIENDDAKQIAKLNGAKGFKDSFSRFLDYKDEAVRAFSLFMLGCAGDISYAPKIAMIVNERDPSFSDRFTGKPTFARGRAALALGALNASEYKPDIAKLLKSKNESDRSGAILALAEIKALEFTSEIVALMTNKDLAFDDDDSPIYFLIETKQAQNFKKEIVQAMLGDSREKVPESAAFALASIGAREHAKDIAHLLNDKFRRGEAAKALALMGAKEYAPRIADMLDDESPLTVADAASALGILGANEYSNKIARVISKHPDSRASVFAAEALLLLKAKKHYSIALPIIEFKRKKRPYPMAGDFHVFFRSQADKLRKQIENELDSLD